MDKVIPQNVHQFKKRYSSVAALWILVSFYSLFPRFQSLKRKVARKRNRKLYHLRLNWFCNYRLNFPAAIESTRNYETGYA